jgi:hypothetical protein
MDYSTKTRQELILICKEKGIKRISGKKKEDIIKLIENFPDTAVTTDSNKIVDIFGGKPSELSQVQRTRNDAGKNEKLDIHKIVTAINDKKPAGLKLIEQFQKKFGKTIVFARERTGSNRETHYDFEVCFENELEIWYKVEHKGSQKYVPIRPDQSPWTAGVQFHNGSCDKYEIGKKYAREYYNIWIGSGVLKKEWNIEAPIPDFDEWFSKDAKIQGNPGTKYGIELKRKVREARGPKASLRETRDAVNEIFNLSDEEMNVFSNESLISLNNILKEKDYWLTIHGDLDGDFYCEWYPKFTIKEIKNITLKKERDIWFNIDCGEIQFRAILRWGKGVGFSNIRIDARD